ncbi:MAG: protein translocase subunit SecD [Candidatus Marinimicrobia bacterium]|nr:protein translocase subunit SecD [Candidatus Neomarinimicrobiota bacterium]
MLSRLSPRLAIITIVFLWVVWALLPTFEYASLSEDDKEAMRTEGTLVNLQNKIINLGLDLQGGIHLVLEVDIPTLIRNLAERKDEQFETMLRRTSELATGTDADFFDVFEQQVAEHNVRLIYHFSNYGTKVPDIIVGLRDEADDAINRALEIIRNRVDEFGVAEPTIQKAGHRRIIVELAGIKDPAQARNLIQNTALLEFNLMQDLEVARDVMLKLDEIIKATGETGLVATETGQTAEQDIPDDEGLEALLGSTGDTTASVSELGISADVLSDHPFSGYVNVAGQNLVVAQRYRYAVESLLERPEVQASIPSDGVFLWSNRAEPLFQQNTNENFYSLYYLYSEPGLTGGVITQAKADIGGMGGSSSNQPVVNVQMNNEGAKTWARLTGANVGRRVALVLDKKVHMAPVIKGKIPGGSTEISGLESMDEAKLTAIVLRAGSLPAPVNIIEERSVGPSLGHDSIRKGINAVLLGGVIVILFMLIYYRGSGFVATLAVFFNIFVVLAALASLRATLTLPGIAGLILTVGMAVDANVLIFERIREELDKGKSVRAAIESGYGRATITIIDANVTTILAALVLFQFGTGPLKGFAITLFWGIAASMFTAIFMTRTIFMAVTQSPKVKSLSI